MRDFQYYNPVKIVFGTRALQRLPSLLKGHTTLLLVAGGGSIKQNGVYEAVKSALLHSGITLHEFFGVQPNPRYETLMLCVEKVKETGATFLLAVGGGSVIDGTKFVAAASSFEGDDPWEILSKGARVTSALPFGTVLTLPATGSEMNAGAVVSRVSTKEKLVFHSEKVFPVFSLMNPEFTLSLPKEQVANGIVDAFVHVLEQYLTYSVEAPLQDLQAVSVLRTLVQEAYPTLEDPTDLVARSNFMWAATNALNGHLALGVPTDWATHLIGHEISALTDLPHARTLACVLPSLLQYQRSRKKAKLAQYGRAVWNLCGGDDRVAEMAIDATVRFFHSLGVATTLSSYTSDTSIIDEIVCRFARRSGGLGEHKDLDSQGVSAILQRAW